jgi:hypothetical protein
MAFERPLKNSESEVQCQGSQRFPPYNPGVCSMISRSVSLVVDRMKKGRTTRLDDSCDFCSVAPMSQYDVTYSGLGAG